MFRLTKWYLDCVTDDGAAFIGYAARLTWGLLTIPYAATLYRPAGGPVSERTVMWPCEPPLMHDEELRWFCRSLGVGARWSPEGRGFSRMLHQSSEGTIGWTCHVPGAPSTIDLAGVGRLRGLGYVEELRMTMRPDQLPFHELRWGRFVSLDDRVAWIQWRGPAARQWLFHNGNEVTHAVIGSEQVEWPADRGLLMWHGAVTLRNGRLGSTALRRVPGARLVAQRAADAHESKWLARGTLSTGCRTSHGWVVHERVRFGRTRHV